MRESVRGGNWDGIRVLGALAVLASHQLLLAGHAQPRIGALTLGSFGVLLFFGASGYLVAGSWRDDPQLLRFAVRRFLRIWPGMAACVTVTAALVLWLHPSTFAHVAAWEFWDRNLFFQRFDWHFFDNRDPRLNPPLWTLQYEAGCYAAFGLAAAALPRAWRWPCAWLAAAGFVVACWGQPVFDPSERPFTYAAALFGGTFAIGALLRFVDLPRRPAWLLGCGLLGAGAMLLGSGLLGLVLMVPPAVVYVGTRAWPVLRSAARFGDLSYGLYLWGWPVQQATLLLLGHQTHWTVLLLASLVASSAMAWLSWHAVEKQALRLKPRARAASAAPPLSMPAP
jgi:peptidoglycan/LPS O-acetylase OafA/YrhL